MAHSYVDIPASAGQSSFVFPKGYISRDHVFVYVDGMLISDWTFQNDSTIVLNAPLENPATVRIRRITPINSLVVPFANADTVTQVDLADNSWQILYNLQELDDFGTNGQPGSGESVTDATLPMSDIATNNVSESRHGFAPKLPGASNWVLKGDGEWDAVADGDLVITDTEAGNVSVDAHGFVPKLPNDAALFLDGEGNWVEPGGGAGGVTDQTIPTTDNTTNNVSATKHGWAPKTPNDAGKFLDGTATYDTVKDSDLATSDITTNNATTSKHGFLPKLDNDAGHFLNGQGNWATPAGGGGGGGDVEVLATDYTQATHNTSTASNQKVLLTIPGGTLSAGKRVRMVSQVGVKHMTGSGQYVQFQLKINGGTPIIYREWSLLAAGWSQFVVEVMITSLGTDSQAITMSVALSGFSGTWTSQPILSGGNIPAQHSYAYDDGSAITVALNTETYISSVDMETIHLGSKLVLEN